MLVLSLLGICNASAFGKVLRRAIVEICSGIEHTEAKSSLF